MPVLAQSVVLTRMEGRASAMPPGETLEAFAATGATLAIHLAVHRIGDVVRMLTPLCGTDCPVAIVVRASWPDQRILRGNLGDIERVFERNPAERTAVILVGRALEPDGFHDSALYDPAYPRRFRPS